MILVLSFFILIVLFLVFGLIFSKVKINVKKMKFKMIREKLYDNEYYVNVGLYLFGKIKFISINFKNNDIQFLGKKANFETVKNSRLYKRILEPDAIKIDKKIILKNIKDLYIKFEKFNLDFSIGTDSTLITSFLIFAISTFVSIIVKRGVTKYNPKKHKFIITPRYENCNLINIDLNCIISLKTYEIVQMIRYINKNSKNQDKFVQEKLVNKKKHYPGYV